MGNEGGAGNLVICEILLFHVNTNVINAVGKIDQHKIDLVARLGGDWYARASGDALFEVPKPLTTLGIGVDALPEHIKFSTFLSGNDLGLLGNTEHLPDESDIQVYKRMHKELLALHENFSGEALRIELHKLAHQHLEKKDVEGAWKILLSE